MHIRGGRAPYRNACCQIVDRAYWSAPVTSPSRAFLIGWGLPFFSLPRRLLGKTRLCHVALLQVSLGVERVPGAGETMLSVGKKSTGEGAGGEHLSSSSPHFGRPLDPI